jgi:hypothetical protein
MATYRNNQRRRNKTGRGQLVWSSPQAQASVAAARREKTTLPHYVPDEGFPERFLDFLVPGELWVTTASTTLRISSMRAKIVSHEGEITWAPRLEEALWYTSSSQSDPQIIVPGTVMLYMAGVRCDELSRGGTPISAPRHSFLVNGGVYVLSACKRANTYVSPAMPSPPTENDLYLAVPGALLSERTP